MEGRGEERERVLGSGFSCDGGMENHLDGMVFLVVFIGRKERSLFSFFVTFGSVS